MAKPSSAQLAKMSLSEIQALRAKEPPRSPKSYSYDIILKNTYQAPCAWDEGGRPFQFKTTKAVHFRGKIEALEEFLSELNSNKFPLYGDNRVVEVRPYSFYAPMPEGGELVTGFLEKKMIFSA